MAVERPCPICQSPSVRRRVPRGPEVQSYRCSTCLAAWEVTTTKVQAPSPVGRHAVERRHGLPIACRECGAIDLVPLERTPTRVMYACLRCGSTLAVRVRAATATELLPVNS